MASQYINLPIGGIALYPTASALPVASFNGAQAITLDTDVFYVYSTNSNTWVAVASPAAAIAITGLNGDASATGPGVAPLTLATVNSNVGSFGDATHVSAITVNGKGLVTAAASTSIQIAESQVTNLVSDLAGKQAVGNYITALTGGVTASGPGSVAATVVSVGGSSAANVHSAELLANAATNANTVSTIVKRDANGGFLAGSVGFASNSSTRPQINLTGAALDGTTDPGGYSIQLNHNTSGNRQLVVLPLGDAGTILGFRFAANVIDAVEGDGVTAVPVVFASQDSGVAIGAIPDPFSPPPFSLLIAPQDGDAFATYRQGADLGADTPSFTITGNGNVISYDSADVPIFNITPGGETIKLGDYTDFYSGGNVVLDWSGVRNPFVVRAYGQDVFGIDNSTQSLAVFNGFELDMNGSPIYMGANGATTGGSTLDMASGDLVGVGPLRLKPSGPVFQHFSNAGNVTTGETDLYSDTIVAGGFNGNGATLRARYGLNLVGSTSTKRVKLYIGGNVILDTGAVAVAVGSSVNIDAMFTQNSSTTLLYNVSAQIVNTSNVVLGTFCVVGQTSYTTASSGIIKITGQAASTGAATNDIVAKLAQIEFLPVNN